jgi:hypothetical protein
MPGLPVPRERAEVVELTALTGTEDGDAARALSRDAIGTGLEVREHDVVLDAVVVHEPHLDDRPFGHAQRGVHHAFDLAAHSDERHLAFGQLGPQTEAHGRRVVRGRALPGHLGHRPGWFGLRRSRLVATGVLSVDGRDEGEQCQSEDQRDGRAHPSRDHDRHPPLGTTLGGP